MCVCVGGGISDGENKVIVENGPSSYLHKLLDFN